MPNDVSMKIPIHPVKFMKKIIVSIIAVAIIAGGAFIGGFMVQNNSTPPIPEPEPEITSADLSQQLQNINELSTVKYIYTNMGQFQQSNDFYGVTIPFTTKKFIVSYDGIIRAGVDISKTTINIDETDIKIIVPAAQIMSHEIDENSLQIFDESKNIFNPISIEDYNQFQIDQKGAIEKKAVDSGLLNDAAENAKIAIENLLSPIAKQEEKMIVFE